MYDVACGSWEGRVIYPEVSEEEEEVVRNVSVRVEWWMSVICASRDICFWSAIGSCRDGSFGGGVSGTRGNQWSGVESE